MTEDPLTYRRAANAALAGLGVQLVLTVLSAVLSIWTQSSAYTAATWHLLGGAILWVALWLIYNQHRLERTEALEAEELAASVGAADTSMFDEAGHDLAVSRKRLEGFYRWGLNVVSITVALYLLIAGGTLLYGAVSSIETAPDEPANFTALYAQALGNPAANMLAVMLATGFAALIGFLAARYVAGMTSEKPWALLRGGSAYLIGNVVVLTALIAACIFELADNEVIFGALAVAIPALMVVLGVEVVLSLVFGAYRPKQPGEPVRPAFDSRLLGWLTRPDSLGQIVAETLNYQFGFEVSKSWFYQLLGKAIVPLLLLGLAVLFALSCLVIVPPQQQALVTTFGGVNPDSALRQPGLSFKAPWPIATVRKYDVSRVRSLRVGSVNDENRTDAAMLWTNTHAEGGEDYLLTAPARGADAAREADGGSVSAGLVGGELILQWRIGDLLAYAGAAGDPGTAAAKPADYLRAVSEAAFADYLAGRDIDTLLTADRLGAAEALKQQIQTAVADMGIDVTYVGLFGLHPPQEGEVAAAFLSVVNALVTQRTTVQDAERERVGTLSGVAGSVEQAQAIYDAILALEDKASGSDAYAQASAEVQRLIDDAGGEAARLIAEARADRWVAVLGERAAAEAFQYQIKSFRNAPDFFRARAYYQMLAEALPGTRLIVASAGAADTPPVFRLDLTDESSGLDSFLGAAEE